MSLTRTAAETELLLGFIEDSEDLVLLDVDRKFRIASCNRGFMRLLEIDDDPTGRPVAEFLDPPSPGAPSGLTFATSGNVRFILRSRSGATWTFEGFVVTGPNGWFVFGSKAILAHSDILDRISRIQEELVDMNRGLRRQLRTSEALTSFCAESENLVVFELDREMKVGPCSKGFLRLLEMPETQERFPLDLYLAPGEMLMLPPLDGPPSEVTMNIFAPGGAVYTFKGSATSTGNGWIVTGARILLTNSDILGKMSRLEGELLNQNRELQKKIRELEEARAEVRALSDLLPICSWCKKVRDDRGYWSAIETFITEHTGTLMTHGICPDCRAKHFEGKE